MDTSAFTVERSAFFSLEQLGRIEEAMYRILEEVGIEVQQEDIRTALAGCGFVGKDGRVRVERKVAEAFLRAVRERNGDQFSLQPQPLQPESARFEVSVSDYSLHVHDLETDRVVPYTTERLIEATKLLHVLHDRSVRGTAPGIPQDVPGPIQPVVQLWVSATYCRGGKSPADIKSLASLPYIVDMAEALGQPLRHITVWVFSPLTLCGESLACVLAMGDRLTSVGVGSMPAMGVTASIHPGDAFALAAAEIVGSAILVRELVGLEPTWSVSVLPADLRTLMQVFGSPENMLLQLMGSEVNAYLHGTPWHPAAGNIHVTAKMPGAQASAERAGLMTAGALLGQRRFGSVGTLSLDEVFSAEQLLYDLEIKEHVERLVRGMDGACDPERCLADVVESTGSEAFAGLESTRAAYRDVYWHPRLFERRSLAAWQAEGCPCIRERVHAEVRELIGRHDYALERDIQKAIDEILADAKAALA